VLVVAGQARAASRGDDEALIPDFDPGVHRLGCIDDERVIRAATVFAVATSTFARNETMIIARLSSASSRCT
jgi:hypothetical protein